MKRGRNHLLPTRGRKPTCASASSKGARKPGEEEEEGGWEMNEEEQCV